MNIQFERLKEKSIQFTMPLVQTRLSDELLKRIIEINDEFSKVEILSKDIETQNTIHNLKRFLELNRHEFTKDLIEDFKEELKEISDDLKWKNSKVGKAVLLLEKWVLDTRAFLDQQIEFKMVLVG